MTALALSFMIGSWSCVLGLAAWCFRRVLRAERRPPSTGPVPGGVDPADTDDVGGRN